MVSFGKISDDQVEGVESNYSFTRYNLNQPKKKDGKWRWREVRANRYIHIMKMVPFEFGRFK